MLRSQLRVQLEDSNMPTTILATRDVPELLERRDFDKRVATAGKPAGIAA